MVSPLLALMGNQVAALKAANIPVASINKNTQFADRELIIRDLCCGELRRRLSLRHADSIRPSKDSPVICDPRVCAY